MHYGKINLRTHIQKLAETSPGGARAWGRIEAARGEVSLREALHRWLYRTPIQGSTHDMDGDEEVVMGFLQAYMDRGAESRNVQADGLAALSDDQDAVQPPFRWHGGVHSRLHDGRGYRGRPSTPFARRSARAEELRVHWPPVGGR